MPADGSVGAPSDPAMWRDAREWFARQHPAIPQHERDARARAFRVAGITSVNLVTEVHQAIARAIADGTTLDDFKREVGAKLAEAWGAPNAARLETIFRTNAQAAYNAGRFAELNRPAMKAVRPFWKYVAILDGRTTATCAPLQGTVRPHDDAFWETHWPPLHFNCRSTVVSLSRAEAARAGGATPVPKAVAPGKGFGTRPDLAGEMLKPTEKAPEAVQEAAQERSAQGPSTPSGRSPQVQAEPVPHPFQPTGTPVSSAFEMSPSAAKHGLDEAAKAVDRVHGDGVLEKVKVETTPGRNNHGEFNYTRFGPPDNIRVALGSSAPRISFFHEVGHLIDCYAIDPPRRGYSAAVSEAPEIQPLMSAIRSSAPIQYLEKLSKRSVVIAPEREGGPRFRHPVDKGHTNYLLKPQELFCRAYSQYVALRSGDSVALQELSRLLRVRLPINYPEHWTDEEFAPIAREFDRLFQAHRWMTPTPPSTPPGTPS
ncbi:MAG: minor capsid protein [Myxococcales bacterium]|nr:minor capsid protein [Myxococcales bacterium]